MRASSAMENKNTIEERRNIEDPRFEGQIASASTESSLPENTVVSVALPVGDLVDPPHSERVTGSPVDLEKASITTADSRKVEDPESSIDLKETEKLVPESELKKAQARIKELKRLLDREALDNEILQEALKCGHERQWIPYSPLLSDKP